jgi:limonene-1,2-epoxide hydrolase
MPDLPPTDPSLSDEAVVRAFFDAMVRLDADAALALVADDIVWENAPFVSARNKASFSRTMRSMFERIQSFEVKYRSVERRADGVVVADRVDIMRASGFLMNLPVVGTFTIRDGLIARWTDRFSYATITWDLLRSLPRMIRYWLRHVLGRG